MRPALTIALCWLPFVCTHLGLAAPAVRSRLVARYGEKGFVYLFSAVAALALAVVVTGYAALRFEGAAGPALGAVPVLRPILIAFVVAGVVLMTGTFARYDRSPYAVIGRAFPEPRGLERITRHPFFTGLTIFSLAHAALATHLVGSVFMLGYAVVSVVGARQQDRKLVARYGAPFVEYRRATSALPFAAILAGRQRLVWSELPLSLMANGLALAFLLRSVHESIFAFAGVGFMAAVLASVGAILVALRDPPLVPDGRDRLAVR